MDDKKLISDISRLLDKSGVKGRQLKDVLREVVQKNWPDMPAWTTLDAPRVEELQKATFGSGVALVFEENGVQKTIVARTGDHYRKEAGAPDAYMIPGGFVNLTSTTGSSRVAPGAAPEDGRTGAAREVEEELKNIDGSPLLSVDPSRLKPMDTRTLAIGAERRIVIGFMLELTAEEVALLRRHQARIEADPAYAKAAALQSINHDSGKAEVSGIAEFPLSDVAGGKCNLLHKDQQSLFQAVEEHYEDAARKTKPRRGPTRAFRDKVMTLEQLQAQVEKWRAQGDEIGVTSGVFDILHPGHISFLEDANRRCGRTVVIVASDRTVRAQKGEEKPYISEQQRAQTIAAIDTADAVIISDEFYHETILKALSPDVMFKGDDYKGKEIKGAELVGRVELIPCAEKEFYSSSAFVRKIKNGGPSQG